MADDKKKTDSKKSDASGSKNGHDVFWDIVGIFLAITIVVYAFTRFSIINFLITPQNGETQNSTEVVQGDYSFWKNIIAKNEDVSFLTVESLSLGGDVISKGLTQIRREPGGSIIGLQKRGVVARVTDGPISAYGTRWWMVDYDTPPSGWVDEKDITTKFFWFYVINFFPILWDYLKNISLVVSILLMFAIIYYWVKEMNTPVYDDFAKSETVNAKPASSQKPLTSTKAPPLDLPTGSDTGLSAQDESVEFREENERWKHVELLLKSHNNSDWRQAIIEADVMLEEMLDKMGYPGVSIGDKLKNVEEGDFQTLDKAWEAHKVRNRIAHNGSDYKLVFDEASRTIDLYRDVFKEFYWI